jgi:hypothetical protein
VNNVGPLQNVPNDPAIVQVREWTVCATLGNQKYCYCNKYKTHTNGGEFYLDIIAVLQISPLCHEGTVFVVSFIEGSEY